ncbi:MAG: DUF4366 domain-containing protein [Lachnospiraceae bacterium]|nr:DUF4366 domain-containing protein [Lachnospiraceae bacterium]
MKNKILKKCFGVLLTTALTAVSVNSTCIAGTANDTTAYETIKVAPENMLNVQVTDKNGNPIDNISASLKDSSGSTVASWITGSQEVTSAPEYNITGDTRFEVPMSTFVAPYPLIHAHDIVNGGGLIVPGDMIMPFYNERRERTIKLTYIADYPTALTVPENNYAIIVDSKWETKDRTVYYKVRDEKYTLNDKAGETNFYFMGDQTDQEVKMAFDTDVYFLPIVQTVNNVLKLSSSPTEYVKMHIKLSDINPYRFTDNGMHIGGSGDEIIQDTSVVLVIVSGAVINIPVPDENGYVDIYVEKSSRKTYVDTNINKNYGDYGSGGGYAAPYDAYDFKTYNFQAPYFPDEGTTLSYVPAGNYTLELADVPQQYKQPTVQNVTITQSKDVHMLKVVLEDAPHTHTADESKWLSDSSNHWHKCSTCDEDVKLDSAAHTPGAEATETTPQTCTICGYVIAPELEHIHDYGDTYKTDADNHWKECRCGDVTERAVHNFKWITDKEATESEDGSKHEECTVCGYKKDDIKIPALKPTPKPEPDTKKPEQPSEKQSTPVTGDNIPAMLLILIVTSIALFGGIVVVGNRKKVSENENI